jgi:hypothetical protein
MVKYKHIPSGNFYELKDNYLHPIFGTARAPLASWILENSKDWVKIVEPQYTITRIKNTRDNGKFANLTLIHFDKKDEYMMQWESEKGTKYGYYVDFMLAGTNHDNIIYSVRRESDGEIFSIGDYTQHGKIISFDYYKEFIAAITYLNKEVGSVSCSLYELHKINQPLLITEDGVEIFGKTGSLYYITNNWVVLKDAYWYNNTNGCKFFYKKEAAEEYIIMNKPCLSINELKQFRMIAGVENNKFYISIYEDILKNLVKTKK